MALNVLVFYCNPFNKYCYEYNIYCTSYTSSLVPALDPSIPLQALLVLHQPETIELWNPDTPMDTFWDIRYWFHFESPLLLII